MCVHRRVHLHTHVHITQHTHAQRTHTAMLIHGSTETVKFSLKDTHLENIDKFVFTEAKNVKLLVSYV